MINGVPFSKDIEIQSDKHHRRSIRLRAYDYSQPGWYFITICTFGRESMFGDIPDGKIMLNTFGKIIYYFWLKIPQHFPNVTLDEFQVMPNHLHGIVHLVGAMHSDYDSAEKPNNVQLNASPLHHDGTCPGSLGAILQNFKSITTRKINHIRKSPGAHLWQRNYYEHIIRGEPELIRIRKYIIENPLKWQDDKYFE